MPWTANDQVMRLRLRFRWLDLLAETMDGWRRHLSGRNASLLAFWGFLSIFPALLAATTILGFVLEDDSELQARLLEGSLGNIPGLSTDLEAGTIQGSGWVLIIGLGTALWSSTRAFAGLQSALDDTWEIDIDERAGLAVQRGKAILGILLIGGAHIGSLVIATVVREAALTLISDLALTAATVVINIGTIAVMYRIMTSATVKWRDVWPGALLAGSAFTVLQHFGTAIVQQITENAGDTYGQFALVLGIVTWMSLIAIATLMCAELNAARVRLRRHAHLEREPEFDLAVRP